MLAQPAAAQCSLHPDRPAAAACSRCGVFICEADVRTAGAGKYCPSCAARPEVDYLEAFRLKYWGRRDGWAWLMGAGSLLNLLWAYIAADQKLWVLVAVHLGMSAFCVAYFFGVRWARPALFAVPLISAAGTIAAAAVAGVEGAARARLIGAALPQAVIAFLVSFAIFADTRNQLFFKVDIPKEKLKKAWDLYANNNIARTGFLLSLLGVVVPGVALLGLTLSIVGLRRVNPNAHPPIGRKGQALAGVVIGCVGMVTGAWLIYKFFQPHQ